jgi:hypothetical protein
VHGSDGIGGWAGPQQVCLCHATCGRATKTLHLKEHMGGGGARSEQVWRARRKNGALTPVFKNPNPPCRVPGGSVRGDAFPASRGHRVSGGHRQCDGPTINRLQLRTGACRGRTRVLVQIHKVQRRSCRRHGPKAGCAFVCDQVCVCVCVGAYACAYAEERYQLKEASQHAGRVGLGGGPDMSRRTGPGAWDPSDHPTCTPLPLVSAVPVRTLVRGCVRMPIRRRRRGNLQKASWRFTGPP